MHLSYSTHAHRAIRLFPSRSLQRLVYAHADACRALGLDVSGTRGQDDSAVQRWLAERASVLPAGLADDLERIEELADERGAASLLDVGTRAGVDLRTIGLDPLEVAVLALLDHRDLFDAAYARRTVEQLKSTTEFGGRWVVGMDEVDSTELRALETRLGHQFDVRARSAHCRISMGRDGGRLIFTIAHGALVRSDEALDGDPMVVRDSAVPVYLSERVLRYRPQRRDVVVYDATVGRLRIRAGDAHTLHAYRRGFGELLRRDPEWFGNGAIVSLEPLIRLGQSVEAPTPGLREVRVVGLILHHTVGAEGTVALDSEDIWPYLRTRLVGGFDDVELLEASFRIVPVGSDRSVIVRVRAPNRVEYGRMPDELFRPYLEARGFFARAEAHCSQ